MTSLEDTLDRAFNAAGLQDRASGVRRTIDDALAAAGLLPSRRPAVARTVEEATAPVDLVGGTFAAHTHQGARGSLAYKLYTPSRRPDGPMPLLVMLHGCQQNPDDFAAGTRMNRLAEQHGFLVAYPAQAPRENGNNCWNWFQRSQQQRSGREPALIAGMVAEIARRAAVDGTKVGVAGLSAGAAMAVVLGHQYPEVFRGIAVHSGLPIGVAHDVPSAFAAMRGQPAERRGVPPAAPAVRTLVIHGDADATVHVSNGDAVVAQALAGFERAGRALRRAEPVVESLGGRRSLRTDHLDADGAVAVRALRVAGGGHAWFGGSRAGSYADPSGPDASAETVQFLLGLQSR